MKRALILNGHWPFAHTFFMETNWSARKLLLSIPAMVAITGLAAEGAGAVIDDGVKVPLLQRTR